MARLLDGETSAYDTWRRIEEIFLSNKSARASALENEFTRHTLKSCGGLDEYCYKLKDIAGQLADVGHPVTETRLVLQLVRGLPDELDTISTLLNQTPPTWDEARNRIHMEQQRQEARANHGNRESALVRTQLNGSDRNTNQPPVDSQKTPYQSNYRGNNYDPNYRGRGRGQWRGGRSRGLGGRNNSQNYGQRSQQQSWNNNYNHQAPQYGFSQSQWASPPTPYPSAPFNPNQQPLMALNTNSVHNRPIWLIMDSPCKILTPHLNLMGSTQTTLELLLIICI